MPYSGYRSEHMGSAMLNPDGSFEAGSYQSLELVYTAGRFGIDDTGSIKIGFRFATDFGPVQFDDPSAPGYTTVEASNRSALEAKWEFKRNIRPWSRSLYVGVQNRFLKPGDTITIRFGDTRFGSPGIRMQTYCEDLFEFRVLVDAFATYDYVPLVDSPKISIVPGPGLTWHAVLPTQRRVNEAFALKIRGNDKWGNPTDQLEKLVRLVPSRAIEGLPRVSRMQASSFATIIDNLASAEQGDLTISVQELDGNELTQTNPLRIVAADASVVHYWADIHGQSNETLGTNTAEDYFTFGRDKAFLDVMSHQGNDFQMTGAFWRNLNRLTALFDEPGKFVCFPGYEWSANTAVGGDRNVFYRREGETIHRSSHAQIADATDLVDEANDAHTATELFDKLRGKDCVTMAHIGGRYADILLAHDGMLETSVEVHSAWGTFEWILRDAFEAGYRVGIVANSDGHKGRPGACFPGASFFGAQGGLTCFLAPRLERDAIFEAMRRRHHYATTGNRLWLNVVAETGSEAELYHRDPDLGASAFEATRHFQMGDIGRVFDTDVQLTVNVVGSAPIERVDLFNGLQHLKTIRPYSASDLGGRYRIMFEGAEYRGRSRATVWDGQLTVEGNRILGCTMLNNWNLDRGIKSATENNVAWEAVTTGNACVIDLRLAERGVGEIAFSTKHVAANVRLKDILLTDTLFEAGGLDRRVRLYGLPDRLRHTSLSHRVVQPIADTGDTRLFVRVTQEDGHLAWSSPIYLFRK
ncbi:MAG: DUF3604 domain-containing protein [Hyphomicrobiaceae bacterium]